MSGKVLVFVDPVMTGVQSELVKVMKDAGYHVLVDALHGRHYDWFANNMSPVHRLYKRGKEKLYDFLVDDLERDMEFYPDFAVYFNDDFGVQYEEWDMLKDHFGCLLEGRVSPYQDHADLVMGKPVVQEAGVGDWCEEDLAEDYQFKMEAVKSMDAMMYEVRKPFADLPYTVIIRDFSDVGHERFFTSLFICSSWGVAVNDVPFLLRIWKYLDMPGEMDLDELLEKHTKACYPSADGPGCPEPKVYRKTMEEVKIGFGRMDEVVGEVFIPEFIKKGV